MFETDKTQHKDNDSNIDEWSDADEDELAKIDFFDNGCELSKFSLECDKLLSAEGTPLQRYRPKYLIVSDFVQQYWCEQQLLYRLSPEAYLLNVSPGVDVSIEESAESKEVKERGSDVHLARELEIQVPVEVEVITKEDAWAVKFLNIQTMILAFTKGHRVAREVPVFGVPFGSGFFVYGIIDELQYNPDLHTVEILELKTRKSCYPPRKSQQDKDAFQVGLYAEMFNDLVRGMVTREMVENHLKLTLDTPLSGGIQRHIHQQNKKVKMKIFTCGDILDMVLSQMQSFTCITKGTVEYVHQESRKQISTFPMTLDQEKLRSLFLKQCEWWRGERGTVGVDVEDCWKCSYCQFAPFCEWRAVKAAESKH
ncbi:unnamed protein product [Candidula unifasciata]|uniref:Exonuclease V n=1 Tax=Candidula unifasciata TaxID=100452 RepID=A0A8S3YJJ2_9EUPU|nr:unnamed protein product [Candidula unifasciata]